MINLNRLRPGPELPSYEPPLATDEEVRNYFSRVLDSFKRKTENRFRLDLVPAETLFWIDGREKKFLITGDYGKLRVEHERIQTLGIEAMVNYGLDPEQPSETNKALQGETTFEWTLFPSPTKPGLAFERYFQYMTETKDPVFVSWSVRDAGPAGWLDRIRKK